MLKTTTTYTKQMKIILLIAYLLAGFIELSGQGPGSGIQDKTILAVFAHADDEIYPGPVLSKYAAQGAKVHLAIVTDGRYGTGQTDLKPGNELVELRKKELDCSCKQFGIEPPITLGYHDQLKLQDGFFGHVPYIQNLLKDLDSLVKKLNPDVIITWGPDGGSNHMDHRIVGASVTQVYLNTYRNKAMKLYFVATPTQNLNGQNQLLRGVDQKYVNVRIQYDPDDSQRAIAAVNCYKSQFSEERMQSRANSILNGDKTVYFRELKVPKKIKTGFFNFD